VLVLKAGRGKVFDDVDFALLRFIKPCDDVLKDAASVQATESAILDLMTPCSLSSMKLAFLE
jgi:hypothetical protein